VSNIPGEFSEVESLLRRRLFFLVMFVSVIVLATLCVGCALMPATQGHVERKVSEEAVQRAKNDVRLSEFDEAVVSGDKTVRAFLSKKNSSELRAELNEQRERQNIARQSDLDLTSIFGSLAGAMTGDYSGLIAGLLGLAGIGGVEAKRRRDVKRAGEMDPNEFKANRS